MLNASSSIDGLTAENTRQTRSSRRTCPHTFLERGRLHLGIPAHFLAIFIASSTVADIASLATTVSTSNSARNLSRAPDGEVTLLCVERHNVFLHLTINPDQNMPRVRAVVNDLVVMTPTQCGGSLKAHCCCFGCRCCCCCCCSACSGKVEDDVQCVAFLSSRLPSLPSLPFSP